MLIKTVNCTPFSVLAINRCPVQAKAIVGSESAMTELRSELEQFKRQCMDNETRIVALEKDVKALAFRCLHQQYDSRLILKVGNSCPDYIRLISN